MLPDRPKPVLCLSEPQYGACLLPHWFKDAEFRDQLALILNCHAVEVAAIAERDALLEDCAAWFNGR